jgi:hypothetical protein
VATHEEKLLAAWQDHGTISGTAKVMGMNRTTVRNHLKKLGLYDGTPQFRGTVGIKEPKVIPLPKGENVKRFILTSAQNNTLLYDRVWTNLLALADYYNAELYVGTFTYDKASYGSKSVKRGKGPNVSDTRELWYDKRIEPYINDEQVEIAPGLVWCGEMNILPTAQRPLQDLQVYTYRKSGIFPHVKMAMDSVPSAKFEPTKFNYTTGAVTKRNYIQKKAGLKAEFHHVYGAVLVEVDSSGNWFVRQLNCDEKGIMYDLDVKVDNGTITEGNRVRAIVWGDIHQCTLEHSVYEMAWGEDGMLDGLKPQYQFMHDVLDFRARNGHTAKKGLIHDRYLAYVQGHDSVEAEVEGVSIFLETTSRPWCNTVVVDSNHDQFMMEWLRIGDYRQDSVNAIYFLEAQLYVYSHIRDNKELPNLLCWACERTLPKKHKVEFLAEDESYILDNIENGMHGNLGPNGARGTRGNYAKMGRRVNRGHEHSASIHDGVYTTGIMGDLEQGYNRGPSSWSRSSIVQYLNGKRAIVTMYNDKWRA